MEKTLSCPPGTVIDSGILKKVHRTRYWELMYINILKRGELREVCQEKSLVFTRDIFLTFSGKTYT